MFWIAVLFIISPIWLQIAIRTGSRTGSGALSFKPYWKRSTQDGSHAVEDLTVEVGFEDCNFTDHRCGPRSARVSASATIPAHKATEYGHALYLVLLSSPDLNSWTQANSLDVPTSQMFPYTKNRNATVSTSACIGPPGFTFVVACVVGHMPDAAPQNCAEGKTSGCAGYSGPPFTECAAIKGVCGPSCTLHRR